MSSSTKTSQPVPEAKNGVKKLKAGTYVVCVDESEASKKVIEYCGKTLCSKDDRVVLLHFYNYEPVPIIPHMGMTFDYDMVNQGLEKRAREQAEKLLKDLLAICKKYDLTVEPKLVLGNERSGSSVKYDIDAYVKKRYSDADFLVCGSRGMGAIGRAFIGSVADYLVHNSSCSVIVVK
eukprot:CAMPEP_0184487222 /NCGR_PEP_ID=MMETSP0113_2-20130426/9517_1 /TAXON_ID=91329 /ORGANISM="Norrisiella sphaerica, Strain BC52" /LENGTH=177 /DNA_ID=CAMNT_0026869437 /DNA_START=94 /DNA_END=627 /DNA_ORIENTATION=+